MNTSAFALSFPATPISLQSVYHPSFNSFLTMLKNPMITLFALTAAAYAAPFDVFVPGIITPSAAIVWIVGAVQTVTWYAYFFHAS
jgi:membrane-bound ClpP family serine protease